MTWPKPTLTGVFLCALVLASGQWWCAYPASQSPAQSATQPALETPEQLQQLVAPIALYPDELVAQILAASTYPAQIVEADRWLQQHTNLKGNDLATEVDKQPWDPSVRRHGPSSHRRGSQPAGMRSSSGVISTSQPSIVVQPSPGEELAGTVGIQIVISRPPPGALAATMVPLCMRTAHSAMARPKPAPPVCRA
jgi:hypothetical protein